MFILLHRIATGVLIAASLTVVGAIGWQIYERRSIFEPVMAAYRTGKVDPSEQPEPVATITGLVVKVESGDVFLLKHPSGRPQRFGLTGVTAPHVNRKAPKHLNELALLSTTNLASLILSNEVVIRANFIDPRGGGHGIVMLNGTNLNALLVAEGQAQVRPEYLKCLSFKERYALLRAQQKAHQDQVGMWK